MKKILLSITYLIICTGIYAQQTIFSPEIQKSQKEFLDNKLGMFIHWGLYSILGNGEWIRNNRNIPEKEYDRLAEQFNPYKYKATEWVKMAKDAGMKYITFVSRHHDGFSMFDTKYSDFNIMNTPYGKDVLKELADACKAEGLKLHLYYSILDWKHPDYQYWTGKTGKGLVRKEKGNWDNYIQFMKNQLTELLTNYGEIGAIWFDGHWDQLDNDVDKTLKAKADWKYDEIYGLIQKLQPGCMIANNHHLDPIPGESFQIFEKDLPGGNTTGFGGQKISKLPLEMCETINDNWGYSITDTNFKSLERIKELFLKGAAHGSNMLLNVGPLATGEIQETVKERFHEFGQWVKKYADAIYGTSAINYPITDEFVILAKGDKRYIHFLKPPKKKLMLNFPGDIKSLQDLTNPQKVKFKKVDSEYYIIYFDNINIEVLEIQL